MSVENVVSKHWSEIVLADKWSRWMIFFEKKIIFKNVGGKWFSVDGLESVEGLFMRQVGVKQTFVVVVSFF